MCITDLNVQLRVMDGTFLDDKLHAVFNSAESKLALFENILSQDQRCPGERNVLTKDDFVSDIKKNYSVLETKIIIF